MIVPASVRTSLASIFLMLGISLWVGCGPLWDEPPATATGPFVKYFGGEMPDSAVAISSTLTRHYLFGTSYSRGADSADALLILTDEAGNELNRKYFGGTEVDQAAFMLQVDEDAWLIGVNRRDTTPVIILVDGDLNEQNQVEIGQGRGTQRLQEAILLPGGNLVLAGSTTQVDTLKNQQPDAPATDDPLDMWFVGIDANLNQLWNRVYGFTGADEVIDLQVNGAGVAVLARTHFPATAANADAMLLYLNEDGFILDQRILDNEFSFNDGTFTQNLDGSWIIARNLTTGIQQGRVTLFSTLSTDLRTLQTFQSSSAISDVGAIRANPDGNYTVWGASEDSRELVLITLTPSGDVLFDPPLLFFGSETFRHQTAGMIIQADGNVLLGATLGWGQDNTIMALIRATPTGLTP